MRPTSIALALSAILLLTACANSDEDVPSNSPTATATPSPANAVIFCPRFGDASTPTTPTPVPSCDPGAQVDDLSGVSLQETEAPPLPPGYTAHSPFYTVKGGAAGLPVQLSVSLLSEELPTGPLGWYTYADGEWQRLDPGVSPIGPAGHPAAFGAFDSLPSNIIVLAEPQ